LGKDLYIGLCKEKPALKKATSKFGGRGTNFRSGFEKLVSNTAYRTNKLIADIPVIPQNIDFE
jgi:hypothetical protein